MCPQFVNATKNVASQQHLPAKGKALLAAQQANIPCCVEDTSLKFHAIGGMPRLYIKWFQDSPNWEAYSGGL